MTTASGNIDEQRQALIRKIALAVGTPTYIYDGAALRQRLALVRQHFELVRFAQKALPNIHVLRLLRMGHALVDCVSDGELERALAAGFRTGLDPAEISFGQPCDPQASDDRRANRARTALRLGWARCRTLARCGRGVGRCGADFIRGKIQPVG